MIRAVMVLVLVTSHAAAQAPPDPVARAGVTERLGAALPRHATFTLPSGEPTTLGAFLDGQRPMLLVLAYARCTMLCSLVLRGVAQVAHAMSLEPGRDYRLVLVSLDARETVDEASRKQATLLAQLARSGGSERWPYLVGSRESIDAVATAVGFRYSWDARTEQYAHPAVIFAVTPDGRVARYLHGVEFDPDGVAAALEDARDGRVLSTEAAEVLRCFRFDPAMRRVGAQAQMLLRVGAAIVFLLLVVGVGFLVAWERRIRRRS